MWSCALAKGKQNEKTWNWLIYAYASFIEALQSSESSEFYVKSILSSKWRDSEERAEVHRIVDENVRSGGNSETGTAWWSWD